MKVYESYKGSNNYLSEISLEEQENVDVKIEVNKNKVKQEIIGFGGAFTESTCYMLSLLEDKEREAVLKNYFSKDESDYNLCRLTIHSCDFAMSNYEYVRDFRDKNLESFDISNDFNYIIPIVKQAQEISSNKIKFLASPWSPPSFMKTTNMMNHGGKLKKEYYEMWALYFVKFIQAYKEQGIDIWAVTVQNEPSAVQTWESCIFNAEEESDFVKNYLAPLFIKHDLDVKIIMHDHNRDDVNERMDVAFNDEELRKIVYGVGIHWYMVEEYENLTTLHDKYPEKHIIFTEGCCELNNGFESGNYENGEKYAHEIINNFNNYCEAFCDWNMVLDHLGGPNHVLNFCEAPVMINYEDNLDITYNNSYYYIKHFSKFIKPGMNVVESIVSNEKLEVLSIKDNENYIYIILNKNNEEVSFEIDGISGKAKANSILTILK